MRLNPIYFGSSETLIRMNPIQVFSGNPSELGSIQTEISMQINLNEFEVGMKGLKILVWTNLNWD